MTIFVDTSALFAVLDRDDRHHPEARAVWVELLEADAELVTTSYVIVEILALAQRRLGQAALRALCADAVPLLRTVWVAEADHAAALAALLASERRDLSFVDMTSFHVMRRLGVEQAFAFDRHFLEQGFGMRPKV
jgi:predicted nucleic acid-binding protein